MTIPTATRTVSPETLHEYNEHLEAVVALADFAPDLAYECALTEQKQLNDSSTRGSELPWRTVACLTAEAALFGAHAEKIPDDISDLLSESLVGLATTKPGLEALYQATLVYNALVVLQDRENPDDPGKYDHLLAVTAEARNNSGFYLGILPQLVEQ